MQGCGALEEAGSSCSAVCMPQAALSHKRCATLSWPGARYLEINLGGGDTLAAALLVSACSVTLQLPSLSGATRLSRALDGRQNFTAYCVAAGVQMTSMQKQLT